MVPVRRLGAPRAHIDKEEERDLAQRGKKKASVEQELLEIGIFTSAHAKTGGDWEPFPAPWRCSQLLLHRWDKSLIIFGININVSFYGLD